MGNLGNTYWFSYPNSDTPDRKLKIRCTKAAGDAPSLSNELDSFELPPLYVEDDPCRVLTVLMAFVVARCTGGIVKGRGELQPGDKVTFTVVEFDESK